MLMKQSGCSMEKQSKLLAAQRNEKTEYYIYRKFSEITKDSHNKQILLRLAEEEIKHHDDWQKLTGKQVQPYRSKIWFYYLLSRVFGISFGLKLMERREENVKITGRKLTGQSDTQEAIVEGANEDKYELDLLRRIQEERLNYIGAIILGLNDALVELTGALAGFTFAMQSSRLIAMAGFITGIAAALSMGGTGYLAIKSEGSKRSPTKFALYTGSSYILTVIVLILPYLLLTNVYVSLGVTLLIAITIILIFNVYISVAQEVSFREKFFEMVVLSLGIAAISFGIGFLMRKFLGVEL
jgi:VIT1/CCC1 family predicted Fe2+/Mn2+ transporter